MTQFLITLAVVAVSFFAGRQLANWMKRNRRGLYTLGPAKVVLADAAKELKRQSHLHPKESTLVKDTPDGKMWAMIANGACPHCKKPTGFYEGPHGGMSINIQCEKCGWWFNVTPAIGIAQDIGFKDERSH